MSRYSALADFYKYGDEFYISEIPFALMSNAELERIINDGVIVWNEELYRRAKEVAKRRKKAVLITSIFFAIITAGASLAATSGSSSAAAPAANAAAAGTGSVAAPVSTVATTVSPAATSTGTWVTVQKVAGYLSTASGIYGKATGSDSAQELSAVSGMVGSPSWDKAMQQGANYLMQQEGIEIDESNLAARAAMDEMIARENAAYKANLDRLALAERTKNEQPVNSGNGQAAAVPSWVVPAALLLLVNA